jgi:hypothetical protein
MFEVKGTIGTEDCVIKFEKRQKTANEVGLQHGEYLYTGTSFALNRLLEESMIDRGPLGRVPTQFKFQDDYLDHQLSAHSLVCNYVMDTITDDKNDFSPPLVDGIFY